MKRRLRVYKKTVSIVNETAIGMYESLEDYIDEEYRDYEAFERGERRPDGI